jgi:hypothetical protein
MRKTLLCLFAGSVLVAHANVRIVATSAELQSFFGTSAVKLAYVESKQLRVIDFSQTTPSALTLLGTTGAIAPQFAPNGDWLVYGQGPVSDMTNNASVKSAAYLIPATGGTPTLAVADAAHEPRFRRSTGTPTLVYSTLGVWDGWKGLGETRIMPVDLSTAQPKLGTATTLASSGSYYGGANDSYIATGSSRAVMSKLSDSPLAPQITLAYSLSKTGSAVDNSERQACNTSIYPGTEYPNVMMSLDFGSASQSNAQINSLKPWGLHDVLFLTRYDGSFVAHFLRPERAAFPSFADESYTSHHFDDAEWSNHPYFAVLNIQVSRAFPDAVGEWVNEEQHEILLALDLRSGESLVLAQTEKVGLGVTSDLQWPNLWVDRNSAGAPVVTADWMDNITSPVLAPRMRKQSNELIFSGRSVFAQEPIGGLRSVDIQGIMVPWIQADATGFRWSAPAGLQGVQVLVGTTSRGITVSKTIWLER